MNNKAITIIKNISYTLSTNFIAFMVSTFITLIIPKIIGIEEYGYWQLYVFYSSYVGFLHFGWVDGIYLRYGGEEYQTLDKKLFFSQFIMLMISQLIISNIIYILTEKFVMNMDRSFILKKVSLVLIVTNVRYMLLYILQATNRIKEYARIILLDRIIYVVFILIFLIIGSKDYKFMINADILSKYITLIYLVFICKEIVIHNIRYFKFTVYETIANINVGIKLMFSNVASMLIIGVVRYGIERTWDVETFGKISLTLSISNMTMLFINAIGVIMFPILRRTNNDKLSKIYSTIRDFLMCLLLGALLIYYPIYSIISKWLPQYTQSLMYMSMVFPVLIYEGKMSLLLNTYLKTLRKEKSMLIINILSLFFSALLTIITTKILVNLDISILIIVLILATRAIIAEIYLSQILKLNINRDIVYEIALTAIFIVSGWYINSWYTTLIYGICYLIYVVIKYKDIKVSIHILKQLVKNSN